MLCTKLANFKFDVCYKSQYSWDWGRVYHGVASPLLFQNSVGIVSLSCLIYRYIQKKNEYHEKGQYFSSLISESETHILYRFITHGVIYFKPLFLEMLMIMAYRSLKPKINCLRKFEYYIRSIKKGYFKQKCQASEKYVHFYALNTWLGLLLHEVLHQFGAAWRQSACGTAQV